jgi:uncharacterized protein
MNRKRFIKKILQGGVAAAFTGSLYSWQVEPFWLEFVPQKMAIKNLPKDLVGKTLLQISDLHVGDRFDRKYLMDALDKAKKYQPDIVVYTGDFVTYESVKQFKQLAEVFKHVVYGKLATVGILGNHDYGKNWSESKVADKIVQILAESGITMLRNETKEVQGLHIIGLDDYWGTNFNPYKLLKAIDHSKANLVLCHNPDMADEPIWGDYSSWILSGHTHGGQCKPPFLDPPVLPVRNRNYTSGQFELSGGRTLYINRALGHTWQVRFNVRPEITIFTLY